MDKIYIVKVLNFDGEYEVFSYHKSKEGAEKNREKAAAANGLFGDEIARWTYIEEGNLQN